MAVFTSVYMRAGHQESVLELAKPVMQGQVLSASDLRIARISLSPGVAIVPTNAVSTVVGRRVSVPLLAGTLLAPGDLAPDYLPPRGSAIVGVGIKSGQMPAAGVFPGDYVDVVMTGILGAPDTATGSATPPDEPISGIVSGPGTILAPDVLVTDVTLPSAISGSDTVVVSLLVPRSIAPGVASASAAGQAALVIVAPDS